MSLIPPNKMFCPARSTKYQVHITNSNAFVLSLRQFVCPGRLDHLVLCKCVMPCSGAEHAIMMREAAPPFIGLLPARSGKELPAAARRLREQLQLPTRLGDFGLLPASRSSQLRRTRHWCRRQRGRMRHRRRPPKTSPLCEASVGVHYRCVKQVLVVFSRPVASGLAVGSSNRLIGGEKEIGRAHV